MNLNERDLIIKSLTAEADFLQGERDRLNKDGRDIPDNLKQDLIALYRVIGYLARQGLAIIRS